MLGEERGRLMAADLLGSSSLTCLLSPLQYLIITCSSIYSTNHQPIGQVQRWELKVQKIPNLPIESINFQLYRRQRIREWSISISTRRWRWSVIIDRRCRRNSQKWWGMISWWFLYRIIKSIQKPNEQHMKIYGYHGYHTVNKYLMAIHIYKTYHLNIVKYVKNVKEC